MGALPILPTPVVERELPEYLARADGQRVRLLSATVLLRMGRGRLPGKRRHDRGRDPARRVDAKTSALPGPGEVPESIHARSVTLSSERLRVIAKMDLVESDGETVTPVDYKHGRPREGKLGLELWPADRAQLAVQGIVLRENGYCVRRGHRLLPQDGAAGARRVRQGADGRDRGADRTGMEGGARGRNSASARGFAEMRGMFAEFDLPAG